MLLSLCLAVEPGWTRLQAQARALSAYAVEFRYPGVSATEKHSRDAVEKCTAIREAARRALGPT